jgi:AraC family ethanolamine operon transcriptional activator
LVNFDTIDDRGWPGEIDRAQVIATEPRKFDAFRTTLRDAPVSRVAFARYTPASRHDRGASRNRSCRRSIWRWPAASLAPEARRLSLGTIWRWSGKFDEFVAVNAGKTLYSADVARQLGVSVRTLHKRGRCDYAAMSMHRYMRLRRLWSVRQQLLRGEPSQSIKAVALMNGFWHMGEFTALYRELFGEGPQQTWRRG